MPYLKQDTTRLQTELQALIAQQAPLNAQLAIQQQAVTAAQAQRTNAVNAVAQAQTRIPPLQTAAACGRRAGGGSRTGGSGCVRTAGRNSSRHLESTLDRLAKKTRPGQDCGDRGPCEGSRGATGCDTGPGTGAGGRPPSRRGRGSGAGHADRDRGAPNAPARRCNSGWLYSIAGRRTSRATR